MTSPTKQKVKKDALKPREKTILLVLVFALLIINLIHSIITLSMVADTKERVMSIEESLTLISPTQTCPQIK